MPRPESRTETITPSGWFASVLICNSRTSKPLSLNAWTAFKIKLRITC